MGKQVKPQGFRIFERFFCRTLELNKNPTQQKTPRNLGEKMSPWAWAQHIAARAKVEHKKQDKVKKLQPRDTPAITNLGMLSCML